MQDESEGGKQLVKLMLDTDSARLLLELAGSPRKQGEYVSKLIRAAAMSPNFLSQIEQAEVSDLRQMLQNILIRLGTVETQLAEVKQIERK